MEVHHHSHTERKKWTHYLWEFLMLFLAVTLGFFVENQREHYVEHQREKTYMASFVEDLKLDTAQLNYLIQLRKERINVVDSLFLLLSTDQYVNDGKAVFRLYVTPYWDILGFYPNDRTMQQLKNAGGLRLIRNQKVSNQITSYDVLVRNRKEYEPLQADIANQINDDIEKLLNPILLYQINRKADSVGQMPILVETARVNSFIEMPGTVTIPPIEKNVKQRLLKNFYTVKKLFILYLRANMMERELAIETLELIKKEYHLK